MGYNLTKATVERMKERLEVLYATRKTRDFPSSKPRSLAYKFREAITASKCHHEFRHYSELDYIYQFKVLEGSVRAHYTGYRIAEKSPIVRPSQENDPGSEVIVEAETLHLPGADTLLDVIGAGLKFAQGTPEIHFPNTRLLYDELVKLHTWTENFGWKIISHGIAGLTLTKRDVDEVIVWKP